MKYPVEITLPMEIIQRITIYNAIVSSVLKDLSKGDQAFLNQRVKDLMDAKALKDFSHTLPDDITLSDLHNDVNIITQTIVNHIKSPASDIQGTPQ